MPQQSRVLSAAEYKAIQDRLMKEAPAGLSEADFYRWVGPRMAEEVAKAENAPVSRAPDASSSMRRFVTNAADVLNPLNIIEGGLQMASSPIETTKQVWSDMGEQAGKAREAFGEGRYVEAAGHGVASAVPILGPAAAAAGEQAAEGDIAGGLGRGAGLSFVSSPSAMRGTAQTARAVVPSNVRGRVAGALERGAEARVADVMSPKGGPNKPRFGNTAAKVSPELMKREGVVGGWTREGMHTRVQEGLSNAERLLDEAGDARLSAKSYETAPIIEALKQRLQKVTAQAVEASQAQRTPTVRISEILDEQGKPIEVPGAKVEAYGKDVVPGPNQTQASVIQRAIAELEALGPTARYEAIRKIRQSYDGPAKAVYNPSMTADFLKAQGEKFGAADVTGVLREHLAKFDPQTAAANAEYALFKSADDVLTAAAEVERTRPTVGRKIMGRLTGTIGGGQIAGAPGAATGFVLGHIMESALNSGVTTRLKTAKLMNDLAKAIRKGDEAKAYTLTQTIRALVKRGTQAVGATTPTERRTIPPLVIREEGAR